MERKTACQRSCVYVLDQGPEAGTTLFDRFHYLKQVFQRSGQAVVFGDGYSAVAELVQHLLQLRPLPLRPADVVSDQLASSRRYQSIEDLVISADADISDNSDSL